MSYTGEIRIFAGPFPPLYWEFCHGQSMQIAEYETLFNLIGTTYGGDGEETFNLPNLRSRVPVHQGNSPMGTTYQLGEAAGVEVASVTLQQLPTHSHRLLASTASGTDAGPGGRVLAAPPGSTPFTRADPDVAMQTGVVQPLGGSQPHENMQPFLVVNFIIMMSGTFPSP